MWFIIMNMNRIKFTVITIVVIVISVLVGLLIADKTNVEPTTSLPTRKLITSIPDTPKIESSGIEINNVFKEEDSKITPQKDVLVSEESLYQILYLTQFDQFLISIITPNFEEARRIAEAEILQKTGVSKEEACKLDVQITTPSYANLELAGKTFGLSFCPSK